MKTISRALLLGATFSSTLALSTAMAQDTDEVIVLSTPYQKAANKVISTTEVLTDEALNASRDKPLGDALSGLPGIDSAGFGPAVGQPLIRGLGGYRIDVMQNGMTVADIAATGGDHANGITLVDADRVEVLKGPAALRYGAFASTGVVNVFNRHLDGDVEDETDVLLGFGDNAGETNTAFHTRRGAFAFTGFAHDADNITIPTHAESDAYHDAHEDGDGDGDDHELVDGEQEGENTASEGRGFSFSGRFGDDQTGLAVLFSSIEKDYGVPGHEEDAHGHDDDDDDDGDDDHEEEHGDASIDFEQQSFQARLTHTPSSDLFNTLQADLVFTTLEQTEFEGDEIGTAYEQDTLHMRGEATASLADWQSLFGIEWREAELTAEAGHHDDNDDDDDDAEAHGYLPSTERSQYGLFAFAERETDDWLTELAFRFDNIELEAEEEHHEEHDEDDDDHEEAYHHEGAQNFDLVNFSAGLARKLDGNLLIGASFSSTQRAPSQVELFANGEHHAAGRTEKGLATSEASIEKETSVSTEFYVRKAWDDSRLRVAYFVNDYRDFIYLEETATHGTFDFKQDDAELTGFEIDYQTALMLGGRKWDASFSYSAMTGELDDGNLPAIPADKIGFGLATSFDAITLQFDVNQVSDQDDTGEEELKTEGYTAIDASASWRPVQYDGLTLTASIRNLTDEEIRHHTSPLKDKMPEPGQDIRITARYKF